MGSDSAANRFSAPFKGNGYTISNLFIKRATRGDAGPFDWISATGRIESVSMENACVYGSDYVGILLGSNRRTVTSSYSTGEVRGTTNVGGLVGYNFGPGADVGGLIRPYRAKPRKPPRQLLYRQLRPTPILDVRGMNRHLKRPPPVSTMTCLLRPFTFLPSSYPRSPRLRAFHAPAVYDRRARLGVSSVGSADFGAEGRRGCASASRRTSTF